MTNFAADLITSTSRAIELIDQAPEPWDTPDARHLARLRRDAARKVRVATAAVVSDLDTHVFMDLMRVVEKLRNGKNGKSKELDHLKLTLELLDYAVDKKKTTHPEYLLWIFNQIYRQLDPVMRQEEQKKITMEGGTYA